MKKLLGVCALLMAMWSCQENPTIRYQRERTQWVDSVYASLNTRQKIGQLFMLGLTSAAEDTLVNKVVKEVADYQVGGLCFLVGTPEKQVAITNKIQANAQIPLLISLDAEWGTAMRFREEQGFPWPMAMGAIQDNLLVEEMAFKIGEELKSVGVHMNFAPVADININPDNPIIGNRSFGSHLENVSDKAIAYAKGLKRAGVLSCAKHFPGHGDTASDSHKTLPQLPFTAARIDSIELYPYKTDLIKETSAVMVAHLDIPSITEAPGTPASLSKKVVTGILKDSLKYEGLIITDALNMKGVTLIAQDGEAELRAFLAGNDVLLVPVNVSKALERMEVAYNEGIFNEQRLAYSVKKILSSKYDMGLHRAYQPLDIKKIRARYESKPNKVFIDTLMNHAITEVKLNSKPIQALEGNVGFIQLGDAPGVLFSTALQKKGVTRIDLNTIDDQELKKYDQIIVGFHKSDDSPYKSYKFSSQEKEWLHQLLNLSIPIHLVVFTSPYSLKELPELDQFQSILVGYLNSDYVQEEMLQFLSGEKKAIGVLPVDLPQLAIENDKM